MKNKSELFNYDTINGLWNAQWVKLLYAEQLYGY